MRSSSWPLAAALLAFAGASLAAQAPDSWRTEARETFAKIIAFRTTEGAGQVPVMAHWLAEKFVAGGFPGEDVRVLPLAGSAALVVRYRGEGSARPVLVLAHMDVVEAKREDWQRDPFTLIEENGYFYGRGTADIKGDIAQITTTFLRLRKEGFRPKRDLVIVFTGDEETAQATTRALTTTHAHEIDAEFALNADGGGGWLDDGSGRPTIYYIQGAEKAYASYEFTVRNPGGHSSRPRADNAIYQLADVIDRLRAHQFPVMSNDWTLGNFRAEAGVTPPPLGSAMAKFAADPADAEAARILSQYPETVGKLRTTCVATLLAGGHADNALPQSATVTFNCRLFPGMHAAEVERTLKQVAGDGVEVRQASGSVVESDASPLRSDVVAAVTRAVHATHPGLQLVPEMAPYTTDGSHFRRAGIPTYGVGAVYLRPKDDFSHGLDERLETDVFYQGLTHWYVLLREVGRLTR
jgi:acetylornithine deacetylase/succinyl-diaminopimelate desuccinylase-like protein